MKSPTLPIPLLGLCTASFLGAVALVAPAVGQITHIPLNYNFNGMVQSPEGSAPDDPNGYRSISDRGVLITMQPGYFATDFVSGHTGLHYFVNTTPYTLDIVHLGNRTVNWPYEAAVPGANANVGTFPTWQPDAASANHTTPQTTSGLNIPMHGNTQIGFIYQVSNVGVGTTASFQIVLGFSDASSATITCTSMDWIRMDQPVPAAGLGMTSHRRIGSLEKPAVTSWPGTNTNDTALAGSIHTQNLSVLESVISVPKMIADGLGDHTGKTLTSITFQNGQWNPVGTPGAGRGYSIIAASYSGSALYGPGSMSTAITPLIVPLGATAKITMRPYLASPGSAPIATIVVDASLVGAGSISLNDNGLNGDSAAADGIWSANLPVATSTLNGQYALPYSITDTGSQFGTGTLTLAVNGTDLGTLPAGTVTFTDPLIAYDTRWVRFVLSADATGALGTYLDIDTEGTLAPLDTFIGLYRADGTRVGAAGDDNDGSGNLSQFSFGAGTRPAVGNGVAYNGRDGSLPAGTYFLAYGANSTGTLSTFNATNFDAYSRTNGPGAINLNLRTNTVPLGGGGVPSVFTNLGTLVDDMLFSGSITVGPGGVAWFKFTLASDVAAASLSFLDIDTEGSTLPDTLIGLYRDDGTGALVAQDDNDGSGFQSQLTFGRGTRAAFGDGLNYNGRDGALLIAGIYYLAVAQPGSIFASNFNVVASGFDAGDATVHLRRGINTGPPILIDHDLGAIAPTSSTNVSLLLPAGTVKWVRFTTSSDINAALGSFLDLDTENSSLSGGTTANDTMIGLYRADGSLVLSDDDDGTNFWSQLSFGAGTRPAAVAGNGLTYNGRDGTLPAGEYFVALVSYQATFGTADWNVTPPATGAGIINLNIRSGVPTSSGPPVNPTLLTLLPDQPVTPLATLDAGGVAWFTFTIPSDINNLDRTYLDIDTENSIVADTVIALYRDTGDQVALDDNDGSGSWSQLTFGAGTVPAPFDGLPYNGRDGATLAAGTYYLAVAEIPSSFGTANFVTYAGNGAGGSVQIRVALGTRPPTFPNILYGPVVNPTNNHSYYLFASGQTWIEAEASATLLGGHLASIGDAAENEWVRTNVLQFDALSRRAWIGATDRNHEGLFVWSDGLPFVYTNWNGAEPNNAGGNEHWVEMLGNGLWNDLPIAGASGGDFAIAEVGDNNTPTNPSGAGAVGPAPIEQGRTVLFTVNAVPGSLPPSTGLSVAADLSGVGGSNNQVFYDDASHGDVTPGDNIFSYSHVIPAAQPIGPASVMFFLTDAEARTGSGAINFTVAVRSWVEQLDGGGDAGDLPATAQTVAGSGSLEKITGTIGASDADMYLINICDPSSFTASTVGSLPALDTQLWLFRPDGTGVVFNDDAAAVGPSTITNTTGLVTAPGNYLLAYSLYNRDPVDALGVLLWNNADPGGTTFTGVRGPDGPAALNPLAAWTGPTTGTGAYTIALTGACYVVAGPVACNLADIVGPAGVPPPDGRLGGEDFLQFMGAFAGSGLLADVVGPAGVPPPDGHVGGEDFLQFLAAFTGGC